MTSLTCAPSSSTTIREYAADRTSTMPMAPSLPQFVGRQNNARPARGADDADLHAEPRQWMAGDSMRHASNNR